MFHNIDDGAKQSLGSEATGRRRGTYRHPYLPAAGSLGGGQRLI